MTSNGENTTNSQEAIDSTQRLPAYTDNDIHAHFINKGDAVPASSYSMFSEQFRKSTPSDFQCALFCGGQKCKYESERKWSQSEMVIPGIYSHWITEDIVAMSRPNMENIEKYNTIQVFKNLGIKSIVNLQERGEHASCGPPLCPSGFSYEPDIFMDNGIYFYNFHWRDYSAGETTTLLDMVKVMSFAATEGKLAVHCHAGLGRTGVLISCFIVYNYRFRPQDAIRYVRSKRPYAVQMKSQIESVYRFAQFVLPLFVVFPSLKNETTRLTLKQWLKRQNVILHGYAQRQLRFIPKIIFYICERILQLSARHEAISPGLKTISSPDGFRKMPTNILFQLDLHEPFTSLFFSSASNDVSRTASQRPSYDEKPSQSSSASSLGNQRTSVTTISNSEGDTSKSSISLPPVEESKGQTSSHSKMRNGVEGSFEKPLATVALPSFLPPINGRVETHQAEVHEDDLSSDGDAASVTSIDKINDIFKQTGCQMIKDEERLNAGLHNFRLPIIDSPMEERRSFDELDGNSGDVPNSPLHHQVDSPNYNVSEVCSLLLKDYQKETSDFFTKFFHFQKELNVRSDAWAKLVEEADIQILSALLWSWLESLSEPLIDKDALVYLVIKADNPVDALRKLDEETRFTLEYLMRFLARLGPPNYEILDLLLRRLFAALTHQSIRLPDGNNIFHPRIGSTAVHGQNIPRVIPPNRTWSEMRRGTGERVLEFGKNFYRMLTNDNVL